LSIVSNLDAFFSGTSNFLGIGRNHGLGKPGENCHRSTKTDEGSGQIEGGIAIPDDRHIFPQLPNLTPIHPNQKIQTSFDSRQRFTGNPQLAVIPHPDSEDDGGKFFFERIESARQINGCSGAKNHAKIFDVGDFPLQDFPRQTVRPQTVTQQAAGQGFLFENCDGIAKTGQIRGGRQTGRTGADHGNPLVSGWTSFGLRLPRMRNFKIRYKPLDIPDGHRLIELRPPAGGFTGMGADAAADAGKNIVPPNQLQGFGVFSGAG